MVLVALPASCILRPARNSDRWVLQRLVLRLIGSEALGFDLRLVGCRLARVLLVWAFVAIAARLTSQPVSPALQSLSIVILGGTALWAIASSLMLLVYILLIPSEPLFNWSNYWVVDCDRQIVACIAMSDFSQFSVLYHVVVQPGWRRKGLASTLVRQVSKAANNPIYLVCKPKLVPLYARCGFERLAWQTLAKPLRVHFRDFERDRRISNIPWEVMGFSQDKTIAPPITVK
ncbi:MAG: GNAT family N-acetyltransferase [Leptolyngbyaceae cyanobacterium bins.302]|nr:GNAT family N-acetyltransferase [Leptolyngbyaceae cyanobacterium bins.302]